MSDLYSYQHPVPKLDVRAEIGRQIVARLKSLELEPTPQVVGALTEMMLRSHPSYAGDSDTILTGLLFSGSYTVDILEMAGVNPLILRNLASESATQDLELEKSFFGKKFASRDAVEIFFQAHSCAGAQAFEFAKRDGGRLETAHLLESAINPRDDTSSYYEPLLRRRRDKKPESPLLQELEIKVLEVIDYLFEEATGESLLDPIRRRTRLTEDEEFKIDRFLGVYAKGVTVEELDFAIAAINKWLVGRQILTDPPDLCMHVMAKLQLLLIGPELFSNSGGNIKSVDAGLQMAKRFSPERDLPTIALSIQGGRVHLGQYTYRNTFLVDSKVQQGFPIKRVQLQAIRPVPLVSLFVIQRLETILSKEDVKESELQEFFEMFPEMLLSLGYTSAQPQIRLTPTDSKSPIPDFILEVPGVKGFDILDLKLPGAKLMARRPQLRISYELTKAVAQLRKYASYFEETENRKKFERDYGLVAFQPELIVVMGRSSEFRSRDERVEIEQQLSSIQLYTYDDILDYGKSRALLIP